MPIPGTKRVRYLEDNVGALEVKLDGDDLRQLGGLAERVSGERYTPPMAAMVER